MSNDTLSLGCFNRIMIAKWDVRKEVLAVVIVAVTISIGLLAFYSYFATNRTGTIASVNPHMNSSITQNMRNPPHDEVSLQVLDGNATAEGLRNNILPIHVIHRLNQYDLQNGTLTIFPIIPMWKYDESAGNQEKEYFQLQDEKGHTISHKTFLYREGIYSPKVTCAPAKDYYGPRLQMETKIPFPMVIPDVNATGIGQHEILVAKYNLFGLSPYDMSGDSASPRTDSKNGVLARYNLTFSSSNNVIAHIPDNAKEMSRMQWDCVTSSDNPTLPSWHLNLYNVVFEMKEDNN